jgi:serine protease Do
MNPAFRRLLALLAVFLTAFIAVSALRTCRAGGSIRDLIPGLAKNGNGFRPEHGTPPKDPPLKVGDVELLARLNSEYARLTQAVVPSVVSIDTAGMRTERMRDIWGRTSVRQYPTQGQGSGVIVTYEGHVVTNHHVIAGQQQIQVTLHDGSRSTRRAPSRR